MSKVAAFGKCDHCLLKGIPYNKQEEKLCFVFAYTGVETSICIDCLSEIVRQFADETGELIFLEVAGT